MKNTSAMSGNPNDVYGQNRTGAAMSPFDMAKMVAPAEAPPPPAGDRTVQAEFRASYIDMAPPLGSIAPPTTLKGAATTAFKKVLGKNPEAFLDKLSERIAFERTGVRLYDLFLEKASHPYAKDLGLPLGELKAIRDEELAHFEMLVQVADDMGADPTMMSPSADVVGVMSQGLVQVLADPRIDAKQALQAILLAELADNDSWPLLVSLAEEQGLPDVAERFARAEEDEQRHLALIRSLIQPGSEPLM